MKHLMIGLLCAICSIPALVLSQTAGWKLEKDEKGIQVYTRKVEGEPLKAFRAVAVLPVSAERVLTEITDVNKGSEWMDKCAESRLISRSGPDSYLAYTLIDIPWPLEDRDLVTEVKVSREEDRIVCYMKNAPNAIPEKDKIIRMPKYEGKWVLIPMDNGSTKVISEGLSSPGGSIPDWLANSGVVDTPYRTMANLIDRVE